MITDLVHTSTIYKVLAICFTYNHSKTIVDALNGFAMQRTTFPFVCVVIDDFSTDGEPDIIYNWIHLEGDMAGVTEIDDSLSKQIVINHKTNHNCTFVFYLLKENLYNQYSKKLELLNTWRDHCIYEALCEGDDCWIDSSKLQRQVDFLDNHPDYTLCFHNAFTIITSSSKSQTVKAFSNRYNQDKDISFEDAIDDWHIPTASIVCRSEVARVYPEWLAHIYSGDLALSLRLLAKGKGRYVNRFMSVYNLTLNGDSSTSSIIRNGVSFMKSEHIKIFSSCYNMPNITNSISSALDRKISELKDEYNYELIKEKKQWYKVFLSFSSFQMFIKNIRQIILKRLLNSLN